MISITIDIDRSIDIVWDYFTKPENWEKWYGGGLKGVSPGWQEGAQLVWENGNYSNIIKFIPKQEVSISGTWTDVTYRFSKISNSSTSVQLVESDPKGGAYYTDGGAAQKKDLENFLKKMKIHVENETNADPTEKDNVTFNEPPVNQPDKGGITKHCPKCNRENEERARFCHNCGANFSDISRPSSKKQVDNTSSSVKMPYSRDTAKISKGFFLGAIAFGMGLSILMDLTAIIIAEQDMDAALRWRGSLLFRTCLDLLCGWF